MLNSKKQNKRKERKTSMENNEKLTPLQMRKLRLWSKYFINIIRPKRF